MSRLSPFNDLHRRLGANLGDYNGWLLPTDYGDVQLESEALYQHSAAFDLSSFGKITIRGEDSRKVLDKLIAGQTDDLQDGKWVWTVICEQNGQLADIVRLGKIGRLFLILTSPAKRSHIMKLAQTCAAGSPGNVKITDETEKTGMLGIYGPSSAEAIDHILPFDIASMEKNSITSISVFMISATVIRGSWLGLDGIEILTGTSACNLAAGAVEKYHKKEFIAPAGMDCLAVAIIEASLPSAVAGGQRGENIGPISLGLGNLIDFSKDFPGRQALEKMARAGPGRLLVGLRAEGKRKTHRNLAIQYDGLEIGWTNEIVWSERFGCCIGFGMIDNEIYDLAEEVQLAGDSLEIAAELVTLPFDKEIAAGFYR